MFEDPGIAAIEKKSGGTPTALFETYWMLLNEVVETVEPDCCAGHRDKDSSSSANHSADDQRGAADDHHCNVPSCAKARISGGRSRLSSDGGATDSNRACCDSRSSRSAALPGGRRW